MDLAQQTNTIVTDFTTQANSSNLGTENAGSVFNVKYAISFSVDDQMPQGTLVHKIPLDNTIQPATANLAALHERYTISALRLDIASVSPYGTASGAVEIAYIPDPTNGNFGDDLAENFSKIVRQSGSIIVRPRDSKVLETKTEGTCYTKASGDPRFYSFGSIAIVVREPPTAGDYVKASMTLVATYQYFKTTINSDTTLVKDKFCAQVIACSNEEILVQLPDYQLPNLIYGRSYGNLIFTVTSKQAGRVVTKVVKPTLLMLKRKERNVFSVDRNLSDAFRGATAINTPYLKQSLPLEVEYFM